MSDWQEHQFADLVRFRNGKSTKGIELGDVPVYGSNGIIGGLARAMYENAIIIGRVGAYCGSVMMSVGGFWATDNTIVAEPIKDKLDLRFGFYLLYSANLNQYAGGSAQPLLTQTNLRGLPFSIPPFEEQRRIAGMLGAYDDLIEVNRRRVALLEDMTHRLFEEWFVRFRFSEAEALPVVDTPDGPLPAGWAWKVVGDVTSYINRGMPPKYDETSSTLVINQKCIRDQRLSLQFARKQSKAVATDKIVRPGDILINSTGVGTLGRVAQAEDVPEGLTADSHVTIVRPNTKSDRDFLGIQLLRLQPVFADMGTGATGQTELSRSAIAAQAIVWPPLDLRESFERYVRPMRALVATLLDANDRLAASRDLLLPRLISGQLSVAVAERELLEAA